MARTEARIKCAIWDDEDFRTLTVEAQWLYHAILEQKDLSLCGVLTWTPRRFAKLASNANAAATKKALDLLRERRYVVLDDDTDELWVRTFIANDRVLDNANSIIGMTNAFGAIHSQALRDALVDGLGDGFMEGLPKRFPNGLPKGFHDRLGKAFVHAVALTCTRPPPRAPVPPASRLPPPLASEDRSSSTLKVVSDASGEEEDHSRESWDGLIVSRLIAKRRHDKRAEPIPEGYRRVAWLKTTADDVLAKHADEIRAHLAEGMAVEAVVDLFEPPDRPVAAPPSPYPPAGQQPEPAHDDVEFDAEGHAFAVPRSVGA